MLFWDDELGSPVHATEEYEPDCRVEAPAVSFGKFWWYTPANSQNLTRAVVPLMSSLDTIEQFECCELWLPTWICYVRTSFTRA